VYAQLSGDALDANLLDRPERHFGEVEDPTGPRIERDELDAIVEHAQPADIAEIGDDRWRRDEPRAKAGRARHDFEELGERLRAALENGIAAPLERRLDAGCLGPGERRLEGVGERVACRDGVTGRAQGVARRGRELREQR
jgi:hypothetical protein